MDRTIVSSWSECMVRELRKAREKPSGVPEIQPYLDSEGENQKPGIDR